MTAWDLVDENYDELNALVSTIAYSFSRTYRMVEREDLAQELWVWLYDERNAKAVERYLTDDNEKRGWRKLGRSLRNRASVYCREIKAKVLGYDPSDEFFYDSGIVRELLPYVWDTDAWVNYSAGSQQNSDTGTPRRSTPPQEGGNFLAMLCDVSRAVDLLRDDDRELLELHYRDSYSYDDIALMEETNAVTVRKRVERAVERLVDKLGGERPLYDGPGSRRAISNSKAQAVTSHQEAGE